MTRVFRSLSLAALVAVGMTSAGTAQDDAAQDTDSTTLPGGGPEALSMGEEAGTGEPQAGDTYVREVNEDWEVRCVMTEDGNDPCQIYQLLADQNGNSVAEIQVFKVPSGSQAAAGATIITPLETLLTQQLRLAVDDGQAKRYPYTFCSAIGCVARVGFTEPEVAAFKRGAEATLTIVPAAAPDQEVNLTISLSGFTASFDSIDAPAGN